MDVPFWTWAAVLGLILVMLAVDLFAHRRAHIIGVREAAAWSGVWVALGVAFGILVWRTWGAEFGQQDFAGYLIEKSLAVDDVSVWAVVFSYFAVPRAFQHRVLFLGVLGALVLRGIFIAAGAVLIQHFSWTLYVFAWILYVFAAFLLYTGWTMIRRREEHLDPQSSSRHRRDLPAPWPHHAEPGPQHPGPLQRPPWTLLTNHGHVLLAVDGSPDAGVSEIAARVRITVRATLAILKDLEAVGHLTRHRVGRRSHYEVDRHQHFRHPATADHEVDELLAIFSPARSDPAQAGP